MVHSNNAYLTLYLGCTPTNLSGAEHQNFYTLISQTIS
jgi:hypothetical protein